MPNEEPKKKYLEKRAMTELMKGVKEKKPKELKLRESKKYTKYPFIEKKLENLGKAAKAEEKPNERK